MSEATGDAPIYLYEDEQEDFSAAIRRIGQQRDAALAEVAALRRALEEARRLLNDMGGYSTGPPKLRQARQALTVIRAALGPQAAEDTDDEQ